ncbi:MAG: Ldh family oxidoreductase, partial [Anaerolineales bacterium]|nr:Ldh family oxidoreductase [Anaerolineales bacterium]
MRQISPQALTDYIAAIFAAVGTPAGTAHLVARSLVGANLAGHDSHGVIRTAQYVTYVENEMLLPAIEPVVTSQVGAISQVDGR